jgi:hypothetical protein
MESQMSDARYDMDWKPLAIIDRKVLDPIRGTATLRLQLSATPAPEWIKAFMMALGDHENNASLKGTGAEVQGATIVCRVSETDLGGAFAMVNRAIASANATYPGILQERQP